MKTDKKPITLIEILLVISLLGLLGGTLIFQTRGLIQTAKVSQEIDRLIEQLSLTQSVALSHQGEITLKLQMGKKGLKLIRKSDEPLEKFSWMLQPIHFSSLAIETKGSYHFSSSGQVAPDLSIRINKNIEIKLDQPCTFYKKSLK